MPKVSIIVPVYNVEQYLKECLDSIINQTLQDIEILCVNDGATDNSGKILDEYAAKDSRIKVIHKQNEGYGKAMNIGLDNATGEYIGIVEPDDYIALDMYESLYNIAKEKDLDLIKADFHRFVGDGDKKTFYYEKLSPLEEYYNKVLNPKEDFNVFKFTINTWAGIYKRDFVEKYHIRHNETPGASYQDNGFWFQTFAFATRIYILNQPFYKNRRDNPNSSIKSKEKVLCIKEEYDFIENILEKNNLKNIFEPIFLYKKYINYIFHLHRIDNKFKKNWLKIFAEDFAKPFEEGKITPEIFSTRIYINLKYLIKNPYKRYRFIKKWRVKNQDKNKLLKIKFAGEINKRQQSRIVFWGASIFLKEFLEEYQITNKNIVGIIDKNPNRKGGYYGGYEIYTPNDINLLKPNTVIVSIANLNKGISEEIEQFIKTNYKHKIKIIGI